MNAQVSDLALWQPEIQKAVDNASELLLAASQAIETESAYSGGADFLKRIKGSAKELDEREKAITKPLNESLKAIRDLFRKPKDLLERAESALKSNLLSFQRAQEARRQEAQRVADELARKERERLAKLQAAAVERGDDVKAEQFQERAQAIVAPVVEVAAPRVAGIATREVWKFEVTDAALVPGQYKVVDEQRIRKVVQALKQDCRIPGVRVWKEDQIAASAV